MRAANTIINPNAGFGGNGGLASNVQKEAKGGGQCTWAGLASGGGAEEACVHVLVNT